MLKGLPVGNSDTAMITYLLHQGRQQFSDLLISISRDSSHIADLLLACDRHRHLLELGDYLVRGQVNASPEVHRVHSSSDTLAALLEQGPGQDGAGGSPISSLIIGLAGHLLQQLGPDVHVPVLEFNGLGHSHSVLGDLGGPEGLVDHHVPALRA